MPQSSVTFRDGSLRGALRRLDPPTRALLDLSFRHRWPPEEIARALDLDVATVLVLRDAALARVAAELGLTENPERAQALLARSAPSNGSASAPAPVSRRPRRLAAGAVAAGAIALAVALPLALGGGTKQRPAPPPARAAVVRPPPAAPPPNPVLHFRRLPGAYVGAAATARLVAGNRLDLSIRGLPAAPRRDFAVWLISSPVRHRVLAHFPGGRSTLVVALPPGFRDARWIAVLRVGRHRLPHRRRLLQLAASRL
jgi:hypothetical protein